MNVVFNFKMALHHFKGNDEQCTYTLQQIKNVNC